ncbi:MAG TPA: divergent polysaccharide deacetylase family protein, partial [Kiloniellaceae bacterium]
PSDSAPSDSAPPEPPAPQPAPPAEEPDAAAEVPPDAAPEGEVVVDIPAIPAAPEQLADWERYRQPFNMEDRRPRIAVVLTGLGLSDSATQAAIEQLPAAVTLSFSPYARGLERWIALARSRGHEVLIDLPMEPTTFPNEDPGPQALLTGLTPQENLDRLDWVLGRGSAYVGVAGSMGSRFTASRAAIEPILQEMKQRGLLFVDRRSTEESLVAALAAEIGVPHAVNDRSIDERQASRVAIDARLAQIERIALTSGVAVAMGQPYPVTLERLAEWTGELTARGFAVAPVSAVVDLQKAP